MNNDLIDFLKFKKINFTIVGRTALHLYGITNVPIRYIEICINRNDIKDLDIDGGLVLTNGKPVLIKLTDEDCREKIRVKEKCIQESIDVETFDHLINYARETDNVYDKFYILKSLISYNPQHKSAIEYFDRINNYSSICLQINAEIKKYQEIPIILAKKCFYPNIGHIPAKSVKYNITNETMNINCSGKLDFVIDKNYSLNIGLDHSFLSNKSGFVLAAGTVELRDDILYITNASGHYMPTNKEMKYALQHFKNLRIKNIVYENIQV